MKSLIGASPASVLIHGPTKLLVDNFHWHAPQTTIVGSYTPKSQDVADHFGLFRGVDQIESFGQTLGAASVFLECQKLRISFKEFKERYVPTFISLGNVQFHSYLEEGDTFVNIGRIKFYKFRQMVADGRIYKIPRGTSPDDYFKDISETKLNEYDLEKELILVAEINDITGRTLKKEQLKSPEYDKTRSN